MFRNSIIRIPLIVAVILLIPYVAMQFTDEVDWDQADFAVAAILLTGALIAYELLVCRSRRTKKRVVVGILIFLILALVWVELAVGIFGTPWAGS